jgi:hypothetical protein
MTFFSVETKISKNRPKKGKKRVKNKIIKENKKANLNPAHQR